MVLKIKNRNILDQFVIEFTDVLKKYSKYAVVSGFLAISSGRARGTEDIDLIVEEMNKELFIKFFAEIYKKNFVCVQGNDPLNIWNTYLKEKDTIRFVKSGTLIPDIEFKFPKTDADRVALLKRQKLKLTGLPIYFGNVESTIAFKEHLLKSPKDIDDAKHLRKIYEDIISENEILRIKKLIERDILKKGLLRSPNLLSYYGRDKTHDEFIDDWVEYIKKTPTSVWKLELNKFIDAQYEKSREFYERFAKSKFERIKKSKSGKF